MRKKITKFSYTFTKPWSWPIFSILGAKKLFLKNLALSSTTPHELLTPYGAPEKTKEPILSSFWAEGWTDLIHETLLYLAWGSINIQVN